MIDFVISKHGVQIRLTDERWAHITEEHSELAGMRFEILETIRNPSYILQGKEGELLAVSEITNGKFFVVVYRELVSDGFVITSFLTRKTKSLFKRKQIWPT